MPSPSTEWEDGPSRTGGRGFIAAVEVAASEREGQGNLLRAAYIASREGVIALMLRGVSVALADEILDPLVASLPKDIPGIIYVDADDPPQARAAMANAKKLYISSAELLALLDTPSLGQCCFAPADLAEQFNPGPGLPGAAFMDQVGRA